MNKKKISIIAIIVVAIALIVGALFFILNKQDKDSTLTLIEKQWIEKNKNTVIDMSIIKDVPVLSYNGSGILFDFLDSLKEATNLAFNNISYTSDSKTEYSFKVTNELTDNDIVFYKDNYALITKEKIKYNNLIDIKKLEIGVLNFELDSINKYLYNCDVTYKTYETKTELLEAFDDLDAIVLLKTTDLKTIIDNDYHIAYTIDEYYTNYVLSLGQNERLNTILSKYFQKWYEDDYLTSYNNNLIKNYFSFNDIIDSEEVKFRSKRYIYGFIENGPYDIMNDSKLVGINSSLLSSFSKFSNSEISYKKYDSISELLNAFNKNEIDLFFNNTYNTEYAIDISKSLNTYSNNIVVLVHYNNKINVNSIKSLIGRQTITIKNSILEKYLNDNGIDTLLFDNNDELFKNIDKNSIIILDSNNYNYYLNNKLKDYRVAYELNINSDYNYIVRDIKDNEGFNKLFNFYLEFNNTKTYINDGMSDLLDIRIIPSILKKIAVILGSVVGLLLVVLLIIKFKPKKTKETFTRTDKLKFIDVLTSLKNRNYLNSIVEKWDNSEIYPQTIIIVDLNNIAYINDNYGHSEGDKVIKEAANILIKNQLGNSEILRTNGNEFLIYLVEYDEKQVVTYMRKLGKELKELSHGFGAAIGYSIITDAIKTVDDAINEATLDMRNNKEEANN